MSDLPRLIATDLDGTLLTSGHGVSNRTRCSLDALRAAGVTVLLVTARAPRSVDEIARQAGHSSIVVCCNGAVVYDVASRTVGHTALIPRETVLAVGQRLRRVLPGALLAVETGRSMRAQPGFGVRWDDAHVDVDTLDLGPAAKMFVRSEGLDLDQLLSAVRSVVGDLVSCSHSGGPGFVELTALDVSKVNAVKAVCASLGIHRSDVVAFGDMPNDLELLRWAGRAWAMGNAHPSLLREFPVTASNDDDGVAKALESLLPVPS
ncbi:hypothetical protein C8D87_10146 [Lentzea atacamensis]|uniref:Hydrolase n=2 Tax=Lentzea TaxID=165301 RepID=A0ABX9EJ61_9PSEU|nr:HAD-IIB family hydrolase [Lentzea atacamensis]RAS69747.1 hypothetical protein C8D87_10146 [Lentzea atacamensis]